MIKFLKIQNLSIIDDIQMSFQSGFSAITGETGAGKSILINAIGLALGWKAPTNAVCGNAAKATVTLIADCAACAPAAAWLESRDLSAGGECRLQRIIGRDGRSRAFVNGAPAPLKQLRELAALLIDVFGQNSHQALMHSERHLGILDAQCGHAGALSELAALSRQWREAHAAMQARREQAAGNKAKLELLRYQFSELELLEPQDAECERLEREHEILGRREALLLACNRACELLEENDNNACSLLAKAAREAGPAHAPHEKLEEISNQIDEALIIAQSAAADLRNFAQDLDLADERLRDVEARLASFHEIARKHKTRPQRLPELKRDMESAIMRLESPAESPEAWQAQLEKTAAQWRAAAQRISKARRKTAVALGLEVSATLAALGMTGAEFNVAFETRAAEAQPRPEGIEDAAFLIRTNPGHAAAELVSVASGGELSRVSLAIQVALAKKHATPVLVFDEVESGVGGATADTIGKLLKSLGARSQVLCVTHLPQVASCADHHYSVNKKSSQTGVRVVLRELKDRDRGMEIARMMAGAKITEKSLAHAHELLENKP